MSGEDQEAFNPPRITVIRDIAKIIWASKNIEEVKAKFKDYILSLFGIEEKTK